MISISSQPLVRGDSKTGAAALNASRSQPCSTFLELRLTAPKRDAGDTAHSDVVDKVGRGEWAGLTGMDGRIAVKGAKATADLGELIGFVCPSCEPAALQGPGRAILSTHSLVQPSAGFQFTI